MERGLTSVLLGTYKYFDTNKVQDLSRSGYTLLYDLAIPALPWVDVQVQRVSVM